MFVNNTKCCSRTNCCTTSAGCHRPVRMSIVWMQSMGQLICNRKLN